MLLLSVFNVSNELGRRTDCVRIEYGRRMRLRCGATIVLYIFILTTYKCGCSVHSILSSMCCV